MTISEGKSRLTSWANSQIGYHEGADNQNKYADVDGIRRMYGWYPQNEAWCDIFVDAAFICCFGYDLASAMTYQYTGRGSAACRTSASLYKENGAWYSTPEVGDQIFFYSGGDINHTGIVTQVGMGAITTVEGNSSDSVARRTYSIGSPAIAGYGRPRWALVENYVPEETRKEEEVVPTPRPDHLYHDYMYTVRINLLKLGDYGPQVRSMQALLKSRGYDCSENGEFDDNTYVAVKKFQADNGLVDDGEVGGITFTKLYNAAI